MTRYSAVRTRAAFSLMELLVVVLIVGALAGMLLPAISLVRNKARDTACANNLRQIYIATSCYAVDADGLLPEPR
jgi:prepilin-type N-terminal cleavage/methylation domain-containing protein